jgi:glycosyltransferase involved in cell wall biosynthesis
MYLQAPSPIAREQSLIHQRTIRILHVVGSMNRGGIETWLMHVLRHIDRDRFQMDFVVHTDQPCAYDDEIRALGSRIIPCLTPHQPLKYMARLWQILRQFGPYDIIHSHVHHFNGYVLAIARQAGVPIRIAHSHNDTTFEEVNAGWLRRLYLSLGTYWARHHATLGLGCSVKAVDDLFERNWQANPQRQVLYYGIDLNPFHEPVDAVALRAELGIPADAFVIGHIGRFEVQKNHEWIVAIATALMQQNPKTYLLLIGEGSLRPAIEQQVKQLGIGDRVRFLGGRSDVPRLMKGAMDLFLFPSLGEGLGLVLIEAQAAGIPCVFSDVVPPEADVVKPLTWRLSLSQPVSKWVETILTAHAESFVITTAEALSEVEASVFNIQTSIQRLSQLYQTQMASLDDGQSLG